jgi:hypothetical protein
LNGVLVGGRRLLQCSTSLMLNSTAIAIEGFPAFDSGRVHLTFRS